MSSYATVEDVLARYEVKLVAMLTGSPRGDTLDQKRLQTALNDAAQEIDDYLSTRYTLPLTETPPSLVSICTDIAIYRLHSLRPAANVDDVLARYRAAIKRLEKLASRKENLAGAPFSPSVRTSTPPRRFEGGVLTDFGGLLLHDPWRRG